MEDVINNFQLISLTVNNKFHILLKTNKNFRYHKAGKNKTKQGHFFSYLLLPGLGRSVTAKGRKAYHVTVTIFCVNNERSGNLFF